MAGNQAAQPFATCSSGQTSSYPGEELIQKLPSAKEETRGITKSSGLNNIPLFFVVPDTFVQDKDNHVPGVVRFSVADSFPENDGWWTPPLHGEDVASLDDLVVKELDNHRDNYSQFTQILKDHGCSTRSIEEDFLLCFKNEGIVQLPEMGLANLQSQMSEEAMSSMKSTLAAAFRIGKQGRILRPSTEELESCLAGTPDHDWKCTWKSLHDVAVGAAKTGDWQMASAQYEACVQVLETMQDSIPVQIQTWLLLWIYIPLVNIYHLRLGNYQRCITIFDDMLSIIPRKQKWTVDEEGLIRLFYSIIWHRRLVLFEWSHKFDSETEGSQLISRYVRSKAFDKIMIRRNLGFIHLQLMVNSFSGRTQDREGDTRVAFCAHLQNLYTESTQPEKVVQWMKEKWRWVRDETHEPKTQWRIKLDDVLNLYVVRTGKKETDDYALQYAQCLISDLEKIKSSLPPLLSDKIDHWNAYLPFVSAEHKEPAERLPLAEETIKQLQKLRERLEKRYRSNTYESSAEEQMAKELMSHVKWTIGLVLSYKTELEMLDHCPFNVEMADRQDANDRFVLSLLEEGIQGSDLRTHMGYADHLLISVGKRFPGEDIETYRDRLHEAIDHFKTHISSLSERDDALRHADDVISPENLVWKQRRICNEQRIFHEFLGYCYALAHKLKLRGVAYNLQDLQSEVPVYNEQMLNMAIEYMEKAQDYVEATNHKSTAIIFAQLGWMHALKVQQYEKRLRAFRDVAPFFKSQYLSLDKESRIQASSGVKRLILQGSCREPRHDHLYVVQLGLHDLIYMLKEKVSTDPFDVVANLAILRIKGYRKLLGLGAEHLTDEDLVKVLQEIQGRLIRDLLLEMKRSSDYIQTSREMGHGTFHLCIHKSHEKSQFSAGERTTGFFNVFQQLMLWEQTVRQIIREDGISEAVVTTPETAEYLCNQTNDLTPSQRALIYAEMGRSRSLIHRFLENRLPEESLNRTDKEVWSMLRETQLLCGENTVFVEYTFNTAHNLVDDLGISDSDYDKKRCHWIVYVVTGEGEVHMRSYTSNVPEFLVARIHNSLSSGEEDNEVYTSLEELYKEFIEPISDLLIDMKPENKLIFALDEVLTNVPFAILRNPQTGEYLFQNHTISFTPAFRVLRHCFQKHESLLRSLTVAPSVALGNPAYPPGSRIRELPCTSEEVMSIPPLFNDNFVRTLMRVQASADNLLAVAKLPHDTVQGFIHVAAHGIVSKNHKSGSLQLAYSNAESEQNPSSSDSHSNRDADDEDDIGDLEEYMEDLAVVLDLRSGKERPSSLKTKKAKEAALAKEKACLSSQKIMECGFDWRTHMVTLSACNSAKGIILGSEGVLGLPRAFLAAGVPCIVASQWSLEDKSSSELMGEFYREMSGGRDAATALRTAMLSRMRPDAMNSHPAVYKWGGYLVWGCPIVTLPPSMLKQ